MTNPYVIGQRIYLRPLAREDAPTVARWMNDPVTRRTISRYRPMSLRTEEQFLERTEDSASDLVLGIALRDGDALIGMAGLHRIDPQARHALFGIVIGPAEQRDRGLGSEATRLMVELAFDTLNLERVWLEVVADNPRAVRVYDKIGFLREGVLRRQHYREGAYHDLIVMGILRGELRPAEAPAAELTATRAAP